MTIAPIRNSNELKSLLEGFSVDPETVTAIVSAAKAPDSVASDAALGALFARKDKNNKVIKVTSARLKNWVLNWKVVLFDLAPALATATVSPSAIVRILALLKALKSIVDATSVTLEEREARIVAAIWEQAGDVVSKSNVQSVVGLVADQFEQGLDHLLSLGIIDIEDDAHIIKTEFMIMV